MLGSNIQYNRGKLRKTNAKREWRQSKSYYPKTRNLWFYVSVLDDFYGGFVGSVHATWRVACPLEIMLGLHRTPEGLGTNLRQKNGQTRGYSELVGKVACFSYVTHQNAISYSWILAITYAHLEPLNWHVELGASFCAPDKNTKHAVFIMQSNMVKEQK